MVTPVKTENNKYTFSHGMQRGKYLDLFILFFSGLQLRDFYITVMSHNSDSSRHTYSLIIQISMQITIDNHTKIQKIM